MVVIDTLRADRVGAYGNPRGLTPFLDSLAARGTVFTRAYAQSAWTNPSVASLMTSRYPSQHGVVVLESVLPESELTLAELLRERGYVTAGFSANPMLPSDHGFGQGFDHYRAYWGTGDPSRPQGANERAQTINADILRWLDERARAKDGRPAFVYAQYMEPHTPYEPPAPLLARLREGREPPDLKAVNYYATYGHLEHVEPAMLRAIEDVYDTEVAAVDAAIAELAAALERRGFLAHAVVVVTADHGEEFKDHGFMGHDFTLYDEVIRVPLIVLAPGARAPAQRREVVELIDVAPTVLDVAGIAPPASFVGRSLRGVLGGRDGAPAPAGTAYSELIKPPGALRLTPHTRALVLGHRKLIEGVAGEREFYALDVDPREQRLAQLPEAEQTLLVDVMARARQRAQDNASPHLARQVDERTRERVRALGYVQ
jgi:arylsulfatase A-like enzyme